MTIGCDMRRELHSQKRRFKTIKGALLLYKKFFGKGALSWDYFESEADLEVYFKFKYSCADEILKRHHNDKEAIATDEENELVRLLRESKFRGRMIQTARLGVFSGDIFIPRIGVCIEVNGPVHYEEIAKAAKDEYKADCLALIGIEVWPWPNEYVTGENSRELTIKLIESLRKAKILKHEKKKKIERVIYISTIASLEESEQMFLFRDDPQGELFLKYFLKLRLDSFGRRNRG